VLLDGRPVRVPGAAERALLAVLLLATDRAVPATSLVDRLWDGTTLPVDPVNAVQLRVSKRAGRREPILLQPHHPPAREVPAAPAAAR